jgi:transglutaminase-like putative cysteine protease
VNAHVREKDYGRGFATALEVLRDRSGDCTEHSVLLAALLRAAGIPARPVVGLACGQNRLVGHMWVEAYVDYWRTLDALDPDTDPIRIRIRAAEDERAVDERDIVRAYSVVGGMRASVTGFTPRAER